MPVRQTKSSSSSPSRIESRGLLLPRKKGARIGLTLAEANSIVAAAVARPEELEILVSLAVCDGELVGGCGVGGGTSEEDDDCARAGVEDLATKAHRA
jgi:uncharacterized protein GlcG (DUF336 family)